MWLSIDTAPRNDQEVLTWDGHQRRIATYAWDDLWQTSGLPAHKPTHWAPLLDPPRSGSDLSRWKGAFQIPSDE